MSEQFAPWAYRPNEVDDWGVVKDARGHWVCQAKGPERDDDVLNEHRRAKTDPWAERARLIAAAPELLAALKLAEDELSRSPFSTQMWPTGMHPQTGVEIIRSAIAKAEKPS